MAKLTIAQMKANLADIRVWRRVLSQWISIGAILGALFIGPPMIVLYFVRQFWRARHLLFSFNGRVGRKAFWLLILSFTMADLLAIAFIVTVVQEFLPGAKFLSETLWLAAALVPFVIAPTAVGVVGLGVRRLHDLDRPNAWLLALYGIPILGVGIFSVPMISQLTRSVVLFLVIIPSFLCTFAVLGFCRGTVGPNKFGADPIARPAKLIKADAPLDHPPRAVRPA